MRPSGSLGQQETGGTSLVAVLCCEGPGQRTCCQSEVFKSLSTQSSSINANARAKLGCSEGHCQKGCCLSQLAVTRGPAPSNQSLGRTWKQWSLLSMRMLAIRLMASTQSSPSRAIGTQRGNRCTPMLDTNFDAARALVNVEVVEQESSFHCQ